MVNPLSYPTSKRPFSQATFNDPPSEYRGAPFWSWNHKQEKAKTVAQVDMFKEMGMGGFHMHTRVGLDIPYMGDEFMDIVKGCVQKAKQEGMQAFLYDEDRWPSGFAGGAVLKDNPELKGLHILFTPWAYGEALPFPPNTLPIANAAPIRSELGTLLARYDVHLVDGFLHSYRKLEDGQDAAHDLWYAYAEPLPDSGFFGDQTYPDLLNPATARKFIETTHDVYKKHCGADFGGTVPSIFTDEPQCCPLTALNQSSGKQDVFIPWTPALPNEYARLHQGDILQSLPELIWDLEDGRVNLTRYRFIDLVCDLFSKSYIGVIAAWCRANGIMCTGHMNNEPRLSSQTPQNGEMMRCYKDMELPGIDMLCDNHEYTTAKQAQSVSRQYGRNGVMCEMYGVTGWQFTFEGHKGQGDWQAALGVTLRVHHLFWSSMEGEAKRDYPACIGYQSPWYKEYNTIETHFARVNSAMTRGKPVTRVAVIHPVESYWLCWGPKDKNFEELEARDKAFTDLTEWLVLGHIDFDFISESLFAEQTHLSDITDRLPVGECSYEVVIVPNLKTIRSTTLERLQQFADRGGKVVIAGDTPILCDAQKSSTPPVIQSAIIVPHSKSQILAAVQPHRDLEMTVNQSTLYRHKGYRADTLVYQLREDGDDRFMFICNIDRKEATPVDVAIRGSWRVHVLDTIKGGTWELAVDHEQGRTLFNWYFDGCESVILRLSPGTPTSTAAKQVAVRTSYKQSAEVILDSVTLSEPNSLLLDYCNYKWNDGPQEGPEEVLRIDQLMRERLGFFRKGAKFRQPHTIPDEGRKAAGFLTLRFAFKSAIEVANASLAIESPHKVKVSLDGTPVSSTPCGWWVDHDIKTLPLPSIPPGQHTLELEYQYNQLTNLERVYILGDFGVAVRGRSTSIVPLDLGQLEWGDIVHQGLPFYTGNVHYHCTLFASEAGPIAVRAAHFSGTTVAVDVDGKRAGLLINEPRTLELGKLSSGKHAIEITLFGNRYNAFGALHLVPGKTDWLGADTWRSDFDWWSEEYCLEKVGILNAPKIMTPGREVPKQVRKGIGH